MQPPDWRARVIEPQALMSASSHIRSVLIGVKYRNYCRTLDNYLLFAIWMGQMRLKLIYIFVTFRLASL